MRRNNTPVHLLEWKTAHLFINAILTTVMLIVSSSAYVAILFMQVLQFFIQIMNLKTGAWGSKEGFFYSSVDEEVRQGQNSIRIISTAITEAAMAAVVSNRFAAIAVLFMYRVDAIRRFHELAEQTEGSKISKDLESLHAAQPAQNPIYGIDMAIPVVFSLLWYHNPLILIHFAIRSACIICRDLSIISSIQCELYNDVITTFVLSVVLVVVILFY